MRKNERIVFERILYPTDLSPESNGALKYAVALAQSYGAKLFLLHCVGSRPAGDAPESSKQLFEGIIAEHTSTNASAPCNWEGLVVEGDAATEIARVAAEQRIDLVVMYSRRNPRAAVLLDSTAESISRIAPCPVLITHQQGQDRADISSQGIDFNRLLVAYDFSGDSELALTYGLSLAQEFQSEVHLMHVLAPNSRPSISESTMLRLSPESAFHRAAKRLHQAVPAEAHLWSEVRHVVSQGQPYREVLAYAGENDIDLICLGASVAGFGQWALFGSNADRILRQASCPVLIARPLKPLARGAGASITCQATSLATDLRRAGAR